ncbi:unnamed protein product [Coregonus sp. 'balchen']|nr:unnamed protein product [Coregonus sp. 'balchen']
MSYDRYLAICYPQQYNIIMTPNRVCILIGAIWLYSFPKCLITLSLTIHLQLCRNFIDKVYCDKYLVTHQLITSMDSVVAVPLITSVSSYIKILTICLKSSIETRQKVFSTFISHLASLLNFSFGCFLTLLQSRFDRPMKNVPTTECIVTTTR